MAGTKLTLHNVKTAELAEWVWTESIPCIACQWTFWVSNWNTQGGFTALSSCACLDGLVLQLLLTYTWLLERKWKDWFLKDNFFVFILSQLHKKLSSKCSVMFHGKSLSPLSDFGSGRVHRCAFIPLHFMNSAESLRHQPWPCQSRTALSSSLSIDNREMSAPESHLHGDVVFLLLSSRLRFAVHPGT